MKDESRIFARWIAVGMGLGFSALVASFALYILGVLPASIPPPDLPRYWGLPVSRYLAATGAPTGWSWVSRLGQGDVLNFAGLAILAATPLAAYVRLMAHFAARRERLSLVLSIAQVVVLATAACGVF